MKTWLRNWIKESFHLYDIGDLTIGGHCGFCDTYVSGVIVPKTWTWCTCPECLRKGKKYINVH